MRDEASGPYVARVKSGEFSEKPLREDHPSPPRSKEPPCIRSQIIAYFDGQGRKVAIVGSVLIFRCRRPNLGQRPVPFGK